jgi:hypothetical protein
MGSLPRFVSIRHPREACLRLERGAGIQDFRQVMDSRLRGSDGLSSSRTASQEAVRKRRG